MIGITVVKPKYNGLLVTPLVGFSHSFKWSDSQFGDA